MANQRLIRIRHFFLEFNLFNNALSNAETLPRERLTTRIYLLSFIVVLFIVVIVAACTPRTINEMEHSPSQSKFEALLRQYPDTLKCPCSRSTTSYETFVTAHVEFHQVCSSKFVTQAWIDSVYIQRNTSLSLVTDDIRPTLTAFWQVISGFCNLSKQAWIEVMTDFGASNLLNPMAIDEQFVQTNVRAALDSSLATVQIALARKLFIIQRTIAGNELVSGLATNFYAHFIESDITISPRIFNECSCSKASGCPHPSVFINSQGQLILVPGIVADCLIIDGALASTLECYYNNTCLSLLHGPLATNVVPLSTTLNKRFFSNTTMQTLLNELMIDELSIEIAFDSFYSQCNPFYCSYTYSHRFDILFIFTTIIGIFGGISSMLRLVARLIVKVISYCKKRFSSNGTHAEALHRRQLQTVFNRLWLVLNIIRQKLVALNLFKGQAPHTPKSLYRERLKTRLFILLLAISVSGFGFYIIFRVQTQVVTVPYPSLDIYQNLYDKYSTNLKCPCSELSIPYGKFLNVTFVLHQVCSSEFISSTWINYMALFDPDRQIRNNLSWAIDIRVVAPSFFQLLSIFCSLATMTIEDAYQAFIVTEFVSGYVLSLSLFTEETQVLIQSFIDSTSNDFVNTLTWIRMTDLANQLMTGANINAVIKLNNDDSVSILNPVFPYITISNETNIGGVGLCSCGRTGQLCTLASAIYLNTANCSPCQHYFIGLLVGCVPLFGLFESSIAWLYKDKYIEQIRSTYSTGILSESPPPTMEPLNTSVHTRFGNSLLWSQLINEMLLETWANDSRFDLFYYACLPISCTYTIEKRRDIIAVLLLLIAVCSSLNRGLKLLVPLVVNLMFFVIEKWQNRNVIQRLPSIGVRIRCFPKKVAHAIVTLNLFKSSSDDVAIICNERIYTRVYLLHLVVIMTIVILHTALIERNKSETRSITSYLEYEQLFALYSNNLQCPCTRISIPYSEFVIQLDVSFHPVCKSDFVSDSWIDYLAGGDSVPNWLNKNDFRFWGATFFKSIQTLCSLVQRNVVNNLLTFGLSTLITEQAISRVQFDNQINATLNNVQTSIPIAFTRTLDLIRLTTQGNALMTTVSSNWIFGLSKSKQNLNASLLTFPISYHNIGKNITCSCATSKSCSQQAQIFAPNSTPYYSIEGLLIGCFQLESILGSSLSCFYSKRCLKAFLDAMPLGDSDSQLTWAIQYGYFTPINALSSRFSANETLETVARAMFIDSWTRNVSYELFFNACAPNQCIIIYYYRFDALEVLTTFLSLLSGVSILLRFFVPYFVRMIKKIRNRLRIAPN